jgi:opacity protein-like surface antigen
VFKKFAISFLLMLAALPELAAADRLRPTLHSNDDGKGSEWAGSYVGALGSYSWSFIKSQEVNNLTGVSTFGLLPYYGSGGHFGVRAGHRSQIGNAVFGVEGDILTGENSGVFSLGGGDAIFRRVKSHATIRAVLGMVLGDNTLLFLSSGFAIGSVHLSVIDTIGMSRLANTKVKSGFALGTGISHFLTPKISITGEYRYLELGKRSISGIIFFDTFRYPTDVKLHTVTVGMNYHFGYSSRR